MKLLYTFLLILISTFSFTQDDESSLREDWNNEELNDTVRLRSMELLIREDYIFTRPDSAIYYANLAYDFAQKKNLKRHMGDALFLKGISYYLLKDYTKALETHDECLLIRKSINDLYDLSISYTHFALIYGDMGEINESIKYYKLSLKLAKEIGDEEQIVAVMGNIGGLYAKTNEDKKALPYFEEVLQIHQNQGNKAGEAQFLNNIGTIYDRNNELYVAINYYNQSLKIFKNIKDVRGIYWSLSNIANANSSLTNYDAAIAYFQEAHDLFQEAGFQKGAAEKLTDIAYIYKNLATYDQAIKYLQDAHKIYTELDDREGLASVFNSSGIIYNLQGDDAKAIENFQFALEIYELMGNRITAAGVLINIGNIYYKLGNSEKAIELFTAAKTIGEESKNNDITANALSDLALIKHEQKEYEKANEYYDQALELFKGINSLEGMAMVINNMGGIYTATNQNEKAYNVFSEALEMYQHLDYKKGIARSYNSRGIAKRYMQEYDASIKNSKKSFDIAKDINVPEEIAVSSSMLFENYNILNKPDSANFYLYEMLNVINSDIDLNFPILSEKEKELLLKSKRKKLNALFSFTYKYQSKFPENIDSSYNAILKLKGLLLKSSTAMRQKILNSDNQKLKNQYFEWISLRKVIAEKFAIGEEVNELEERANLLEKDLVKASSTFEEFQHKGKLDWKEIQANLKEREAAIEFVRFNYLRDIEYDTTAYTLYCALIVKKDIKHPLLVGVFEESQLEEVVGKFPGNNKTYIDQIYGKKSNLKNKLYDLIWRPLEKELKGIKKVYYSPDGLLHKISFSALSKNKEVYLSDLYELKGLGSTEQVASQHKGTIESPKITLYGGINYNITEGIKEIWPYLKGTKTEVDSIRSLLKDSNWEINVLMAENGTESSFKNEADKSNIFHVATHGFFYPDQNEAKQELFKDEEYIEEIIFRGASSSYGNRSFLYSTNPLMRSGIVFAGVNDTWNSAENIDGDDGILTAQEVVLLNMQNVELVVLSACETGLGEIRGSEGVYGLQRSFKIAGVEKMIMSLWQVPDKETAEFMSLFYKNILKEKDIRVSFNKAQETMKDKYDPYFWAAFVLIE